MPEERGYLVMVHKVKIAVIANLSLKVLITSNANYAVQVGLLLFLAKPLFF